MVLHAVSALHAAEADLQEPDVAAVATLPVVTRRTAVTATTTDATVSDLEAATASVTARTTVSERMTVMPRTSVTVMRSARVCPYHFATSTTMMKT